MNILFLNSIGRDTWGGGEKWMLTAAAGLRRRGHQVCLSARQHGALIARGRELGLPALPLAIRGDFNVWAAWQLRRFIAARDVEIVVANFNRDVRLTGLARGLARRPLIVARNGLPILQDNWRYRRTYRRLVAGIVTNTEAIRRRYLGYGWIPEDFVRVIHNGIDPQVAPRAMGPGPADEDLRARHRLARGVPIVGIFGRLVRQKRHDLFLEAARRVVAAHPETLLLIVGEGPERASIERTAAELGLAAHIRMAGFQPDVFPLLACCDVVALTSDDEGLPNALMEAMLAGRAVVSFGVGGVEELLGAAGETSGSEGGVIVAAGDPVALAAEVNRLLEDPSRAAALGRRARERILREFTVEKMIAQFEGYLLELLRRDSEEGRAGLKS
ncbi:MAG: glycosyltransferase [Candidatus Eisenbacteria bacterium]